MGGRRSPQASAIHALSVTQVIVYLTECNATQDDEQMATCQNCGVRSATTPGAITIDEVFVAKSLKEAALSGTQMKVSGTKIARMSCQCGWSIDGFLDADTFWGFPNTQKFPDEPHE